MTSAGSSQPIVPKFRITGRRAAPRVRLCIPARVLLLHGQENCLLDDLSQSGARVTIAAKLPMPGAGVVLTAQGLDVFGNVVWSQGVRFGILFEEPLPLHDVVNLRHFADAHADHERALLRRNARNFVQGQPRLRRFS
ncbi:PilZ domain-containing protein [Novosphingobium sp.]|uniref:PilZ domain-containing protein n=1 Tax=Novosphingobium sp. TaxID=1874826 RepID=UPI001D82982E|nr:PilZ domain-containing protein [Novosphingobium sp.]MBX9662248.1 PilZ domain-containing protein [Novosphingobium sp.]